LTTLQTNTDTQSGKICYGREKLFTQLTSQTTQANFKKQKTITTYKAVV
jgi:hypothetical protein